MVSLYIVTIIYKYNIHMCYIHTSYLAINTHLIFFIILMSLNNLTNLEISHICIIIYNSWHFSITQKGRHRGFAVPSPQDSWVKLQFEWETDSCLESGSWDCRLRVNTLYTDSNFALWIFKFPRLENYKIEIFHSLVVMRANIN